MRDIRFRAWDKSDKVMREVYGLLYPKISNHGNREKFMVNMHCSDYEGSKAIILSDFERPLDEVELMQYTGLKDKNGKEIYEGDVVKFDRKGHFQNSQFEWIGEVIKESSGTWEIKGEFQCDDNESLDQVRIYPYNDMMEVVGNIYSNPELLN